MPQLEDIMSYLKAKEKEVNDGKVEQLRYQWGVGVVMSELQADPRWAIYGNHLKALQEEEERRMKSYQNKLTGRDFLTAGAYGQLKIDLARSEGRAVGFQEALDLAKKLIIRGEMAKGAVETEVPTEKVGN